MQKFQEDFHSDQFDYRKGSPHLKHWHLYSSLVSKLRQVLETTASNGISATLLDVGAGEGSFVEPILSSGYSVMALEMSRPAIDKLSSRYGRNPAFRVEFDEDGSLEVLGSERFGVILYTSVIHHIPDYIEALENAMNEHLQPGGAVVCFQDPLLYSSVPHLTRKATQIAYFGWRITQGNLRQGISTRIRRLRRVYDESNAADMSEYHVVRDGVDQSKILDILADKFEDVSMFTYWSTQSRFWQWIGERLGLSNTFGITASGFHGSKHS